MSAMTIKHLKTSLLLYITKTCKHRYVLISKAISAYKHQQRLAILSFLTLITPKPVPNNYYYFVGQFLTPDNYYYQ